MKKELLSRLGWRTSCGIRGDSYCAPERCLKRPDDDDEMEQTQLEGAVSEHRDSGYVFARGVSGI